MKLSEKLYRLRRQNGLSQEQAAERLDVSRQAISKWESGQSVPDPDKLIALSKLYDITTDYLLLEDAPEPVDKPRPSAYSGPRRVFAAGLLLCLLGVGGLLFWGLTTSFFPAAAGRLDASSAVALNGSGILALLCVTALAAGAVLLLRKRK